MNREDERVVITRNGVPAAVLISPEDLEGLEETLRVPGDSDAVRAIGEAQAALAQGDSVRDVDAVRALHPR